MIECIFTIDYEIFGNSEGSLREHVYEPAECLRKIFLKWNARFVPFVEVAEIEMIEKAGSDPAIDLVKQQLRDFHREGFELGLHLHPQWYNARLINGKWRLDYSEYNLCILPESRIAEIIDRALEYLRNVLSVHDYTPLSFRAGNWLLQPSERISRILNDRGIRIDSSVFKGGVRHSYNLDYRPSLKNGYYWYFCDDVNADKSDGPLLEVPIYTEMVPFWRLLNSKRISLEANASSKQNIKSKANRVLDLLRFLHPMKLDFCRMNSDDIASVMTRIIQEDSADQHSFRPIVLIGHTKELNDLETVDSALSFLRQKKIVISTFDEIYHKCIDHLNLHKRK